MLFLTPNQQCQSTAGKCLFLVIICKHDVAHKPKVHNISQLNSERAVKQLDQATIGQNCTCSFRDTLVEHTDTNTNAQTRTNTHSTILGQINKLPISLSMQNQVTGLKNKNSCRVKVRSHWVSVCQTHTHIYHIAFAVNIIINSRTKQLIFHAV